MVKLKYIGAMAKGMATSINFKIAVEKDKVYDIPLTVSDHFLKTSDWIKVSETKVKKKEKIKIIDEEVKEEMYDTYNKED